MPLCFRSGAAWAPTPLPWLLLLTRSRLILSTAIITVTFVYFFATASTLHFIEHHLAFHHNTICTSIPFLSRRECYYFLVGALVDLLKKSLCSQPTLQALFVNKIQEYAAKKKAADGGMVDATPETQADLQVLKRIAVSHWNVVNETSRALMR